MFPNRTRSRGRRDAEAREAREAREKAAEAEAGMLELQARWASDDQRAAQAGLLALQARSGLFDVFELQGLECILTLLH